MRTRKAVKGDACTKCAVVPWPGEKVYLSPGKVWCQDCENGGFDDKQGNG